MIEKYHELVGRPVPVVHYHNVDQNRIDWGRDIRDVNKNDVDNDNNKKIEIMCEVEL